MKAISPPTTRSIPAEFWQNRSRFREPIIKSARPLAKKIARYYARGSVDRFDDLEAVALEALNSAIDDYDPERAAFSTHARTRMESAIKHELRRNSSVPRAWLEAYQKVLREAKKVNEMRSKFGHPALSLREVAQRLRIQEWDRIVGAMHAPNPIGLVGVEQEYKSMEDEEDDLVQKARQVLFQLPKQQRESIELWMYRDKRDAYFCEAFEAVKTILLEAA